MVGRPRPDTPAEPEPNSQGGNTLHTFNPKREKKKSLVFMHREAGLGFGSLPSLSHSVSDAVLSTACYREGVYVAEEGAVPWL